MLAQNPANTFVRYGLAMELINSGGLEQAMQEFASILSTDPTYGAAYFHGGQTLEKLGRLGDARDYYQRGVVHAADPHARSELQAALDKLAALDILGE